MHEPANPAIGVGGEVQHPTGTVQPQRSDARSVLCPLGGCSPLCLELRVVFSQLPPDAERGEALDV
eukprot:2375-Eustigmatos_ZCMA.PRE.1